MKYLSYYGYCSWFISCICIFILTLCRFLIDYALIAWSEYSFGGNGLIYWISVCMVWLVTMMQGVIKAFIMGNCFSSAAFNLNKDMLNGILKRPISFFTQTPIGQLINKATKDVMIHDDLLHRFLNECVMYGTYILIIMMLMIFSTPIMILPIILMVFMVSSYVLKVGKLSTDFRRITGICLSPVISNISELVEGRVVLLNYNFKDQLKDKFYDGLEKLTTSFMHERMVMIYFYIKVDILVCIVNFFCSMGISASKITGILFMNKEVYAVLISNIYVFSTAVAYFMEYLSELSIVLASTDRIIDISRPDEIEPKWESPKPAPNWPKQGRVEVKNL